MFLHRAEADDDDMENWRFFPQDFKDKNDASVNHRDLVEYLYNFSQGEKYITCGQDGTFRLWNAPDLRHLKTVSLIFPIKKVNRRSGLSAKMLSIRQQSGT